MNTQPSMLATPTASATASWAVYPVGAVVDILLPTGGSVDVEYGLTVTGHPFSVQPRLHTVTFRSGASLIVDVSRLRSSTGVFTSGTDDYAAGHDAHMRTVYAPVTALTAPLRPEHAACRTRTPDEDQAVLAAMERRELRSVPAEIDELLVGDPWQVRGCGRSVDEGLWLTYFCRQAPGHRGACTPDSLIPGRPELSRLADS